MWKEKEGKRRKRRERGGRERQRETGAHRERPLVAINCYGTSTVPLTPLMLTAQGCPEGHVPRLKPRTKAAEVLRLSPPLPAPLTVGLGYARDPGRKKLACPPRARSRLLPRALGHFLLHLSGCLLRPCGPFLPLLPIAPGPRRLLNRL